MSKIIKQDTQGTKPLLQVGEFGYDNWVAGGDIGRVYVGTGSSNIAIAKKAEVAAVDSKADTHIVRVDNPHGVTKAQVGLGSVDNTSDIDKPISTAVQTALDTKQAVLVSGTNIKTIEGQSIVGSGNIDLSKSDVGLSNVDNTADSSKNVLSATKWTTARTLSLTGDVTGSSSIDGSTNISIDVTLDIDGATDIGVNLSDTDLIIVDKGANGTNRKSAISRIWTYISGKLTGAISTVITSNLTASKVLVSDVSGKIVASTTTSTELGYVSGVTSAIQTQLNAKVETNGLTVTDNAIVRFDGTTGKVQTSGVIIDDSGNIGIGTNNPVTKLHITSDNSPLAAGLPQFIISGNVNKERIAIRSSMGGAVINVGCCGGTIESPSSITNGMFLGGYQFGGYAGSTSMWTRGAQIAGFANGGWTDTSCPADISFMTVPSGSGSLIERMRIDSVGNVLVTSPAGLGYGTGSGGTVTQLTSKTTAVTLNKPSGRIIMSNTTLAQNVKVTFLLYNSNISDYDNIHITVTSGSSVLAQYEARGRCANGVAEIVVSHTYTGTLGDAIILTFTVIKGAVA